MNDIETRVQQFIINQIRENLAWLVKNTDVVWYMEQKWDPVYDEPVHGLSFDNAVETIDTIWDDEA